MDFLEIIVVLAVGYTIGKIHAYYGFAKLLKDLAEEAGLDLERELSKITEDDEPDTVRKLKIDGAGGILYLFDMDTDTFICQAECVQDLARFAKERSQILYAVVKHGDKFFTFKDGESTEVKYES
jgi:hypothetical protein